LALARGQTSDAVRQIISAQGELDALVTDPWCWAARYTVNPFLVAVGAPKSKVLAQRSPPATRKVHPLTIDRIRDPPTPHELKHHADCSSMRSTGKRLSSTGSSRRHGTVPASNRPYCQRTVVHPIATLGQPLIRCRVFEADMYAADVLRNTRSRACAPTTCPSARPASAAARISPASCST
jgi:hypothetical protein